MRCSTRSRRWSNGRCRSPGASRRAFLALPREVLIATLQDHQRYFAGRGRARRAAAVVHHRQQHREPRPGQGPRRQRARRAAAPRRRRVLLGPGPQASARRAPRRLDARDLPGTARAHCGATRRARQRARRRTSRPHSVPRIRSGRVQRPSCCKCDLHDRDGRRVPGAAGHHGPLLRARRRRRCRASPRRSASSTCRAAPATRCPRTPIGIARRDRRQARHARRHLRDRTGPSGTRDPFGLRRAAIGVLRIVLERALELDLDDLIARAVALAEPTCGAPRRGRARHERRAGATDARAGRRDPRLHPRAARARSTSKPTAERHDDRGVRRRAGRRPRSTARSRCAPRALARIPRAARRGERSRPRTSASRTSCARRRAQPRRRAERQLSARARGAPPCRRDGGGAPRASMAALARRDYALRLRDARRRWRPTVDAFFEQVMVNDPDPQPAQQPPRAAAPRCAGCSTRSRTSPAAGLTGSSPPASACSSRLAGLHDVPVRCGRSATAIFIVHRLAAAAVPRTLRARARLGAAMLLWVLERTCGLRLRRRGPREPPGRQSRRADQALLELGDDRADSCCSRRRSGCSSAS